MVSCLLLGVALLPAPLGAPGNATVSPNPVPAGQQFDGSASCAAIGAGSLPLALIAGALRVRRWPVR